MDIIGIVFVLALFILLCLRGYNTIVCAFFCAVLAILVTRQPLVDTWRSVFLVGAGSTVTQLAGNFFAGSFFGKIFQSSGAATSIAHWVIKLFRGNRKKLHPAIAIIAIYLPCLILGFGGITGAPIALILVPLALEIMKESDIPRVMGPAVVLGVVLTSLQCMPGAPQLNNIICMELLGTPSAASLFAGIITGVFILCINTIFVVHAARKYCRTHPSSDLGYQNDVDKSICKLPNVFISVLPLVFVFCAFNLLNWFITYVLLAATLISVILFVAAGTLELKNVPTILAEAATNIAPIVIICAIVAGFGNIITSSPAFSTISSALLNIPAPPIVAVAIVVGVVACICGNALTSLQIVLPAFKNIFVTAGVRLPALHRVACYASVTLDSLPTSSMVILTTQLCGVTLKDSYRYVFVTTVLNTSIGTLLCCLLVTLFPSLP